MASYIIEDKNKNVALIIRDDSIYCKVLPVSVLIDAAAVYSLDDFHWIKGTFLHVECPTIETYLARRKQTLDTVKQAQPIINQKTHAVIAYAVDDFYCGSS